jgi:hypothetical protein
VSTTPAEGYYAARRERMLRGFDRASPRFARSLERHHDAAFAEQVPREARVEFERLLPELPYIGGRRNLFSWVMVVNGWLVALFRAMQARGGSAEQTMRVAADVSDELFRSFPGLVLRLVGRLAFTPPVRHVLRKQAERSQERRFGADFVFQFREGDGDDWALVFDECAVNKFYEAQGTPELSPYCNFFDVTYSRLMGLGLDASETIGLGCPQCKLRFAHGRATPVPKTLAAVLPGAGS